MRDIKMKKKKNVAVFFGGRSPEHDVSIVTGLQVLQAIDSSLYNPFPVYIAADGSWLIGELLFKRENYIPDVNTLKQLTSVTIDVSVMGKGILYSSKKGIFSQSKQFVFDVAVPAFHGLIGEDGQIQGLFETANIPYAGMRTMASNIFMDKAFTKRILSGLGIPLLPCKVIEKPPEGLLLSPKSLIEETKDLDFPCCLKPCHLGSSIGVAKVNNPEELNAVLPRIFKYDTTAIVEPFVENAVEFNIAVRRNKGQIVTSAIERPKHSAELLDFKQKYLSGEDNKAGSKTPGEISQGMLSLTRELNPKLDEKFERNIRGWATVAFEALNGSGVPRIDFLYNERTHEIWLNEINPIPGSFGYFLWEAIEQPVLFTELLTDLIEEAFYLHKRAQIPIDPTPEEAMLFRRK